MTLATIEVDLNGNKVIKFTGLRLKIQTNGNLPYIHRTFEVGTIIHKFGIVPLTEIKDWVKKYGTPRAFLAVSKLTTN